MIVWELKEREREKRSVVKVRGAVFIKREGQ